MSSDRRGGGGALFTLLLVLGFVVTFWWVFAILAGLIVLGGVAWYAACRVDARYAAQAAIAARADEQHAWVLAGDHRGIYGDYMPATDLDGFVDGLVARRTTFSAADRPEVYPSG
jgi:hypothetical protein